MSAGLPLMKNVLTPLVKSVLILLGKASATDAAIQIKFFGSGIQALIISNEEMEDIMKIAKSLKEPGLLIKGVSETIKNEIKKQNSGLLRMLLGPLKPKTLGQRVIGVAAGVIFVGKGAVRAS